MATNNFLEPPINHKSDDYPRTKYQEAEKEWDMRIGDARKAAHSWKMAFFISMLICAIMSGGLTYMSSKSMVKAIVVMIDPDGIVLNIRPLIEMDYTPQEQQVRHFISEFVKNTRAIPFDSKRFKDNWKSAYNFMSNSAANKMSARIREDNPVNRVGKETVEINIKSVNPAPSSPNTYQVIWAEEVFSIDGASKEKYAMTGLFTVDFITPKTEKELLSNPLGMYIRDFSWSRDI